MAAGQIQLSAASVVLDLSPVAGARDGDSRSGSVSPPQGQPVELATSDDASLSEISSAAVSSTSLPPSIFIGSLTADGDSHVYPGGAASERTARREDADDWDMATELWHMRYDLQLTETMATMASWWRSCGPKPVLPLCLNSGRGKTCPFLSVIIQ
jgi:hypothetical protein